MGQAAARLHDPVAHSHALGGFIAGAVVGVAGAFAAALAIGAVVGAIALEVGTAGLATPLIVGVAATAVEFGATAYVGTKITEFAQGTGERLGGESMGPASGSVSQGSSSVLVNGRPAARVADAETCDAGVIAQGSDSVLVNGRPFARVGDKVSCGGAILSGSPDVFVGGGTRTEGTVRSEVPEWVRWAALIAGILPALGQAARAIGPALAEVEATGFGRAAQTGVKALGRAMEKRGGGPRPPAGARSLDDLVADAEKAPAPKSAVPEGVPLNQAEFDRIRALPKGERPSPETYLPKDYINNHLAQFDNGGSYLTPTENLDRFGRTQLGRPDGVFVMPKAEMDGLMMRTGGDVAKIETELGIPPGTWDKPGATLSRIDIPAPRDLELRMPSGNEGGANDLWLPGGKLPTRGSEAVTNTVPSGSYVETLIGKGSR